MIYTEEEKEFVAKANEYLRLAENNQKVTLTKFLTLREQAIIQDVFRKSNIEILLDGGYDEAERKRCLISPFGGNLDLLNIRCFKINYQKRYLTITHQNVLGTLMSFKLDRTLFGDIVFEGDAGYFYASADIEPILMMDFKSINQVPIELKVVNERLEFKERYETKEVIVSSLRLDNLVKTVYKMSRNDSQKLISNNLVYKNFQIMTNTSSLCKKDDIISVRRHGRFIVGEVLRTTKSNRNVLEIKIPAR